MPSVSVSASRRSISCPSRGKRQSSPGSGQKSWCSAKRRRAPRAEGRHQRIDHAAAAVQLDREIELARLDLGEEAGQRIDRRRHLGQTGKAGKGDELVDVRQAMREALAPRQADERDARRRIGAAQRAQRRHRAQHVAEHQRPEHDDAPHLAARHAQRRRRPWREALVRRRARGRALGTRRRDVRTARRDAREPGRRARRSSPHAGACTTIGCTPRCSSRARKRGSVASAARPRVRPRECSSCSAASTTSLGATRRRQSLCCCGQTLFMQ